MPGSIQRAKKMGSSEFDPHITTSAPRTASAGSSYMRSTSPSSSALERVASERAQPTRLRASPCFLQARASDEPIRPMPMKAMRSNRNFLAMTARPNA